MEPYKEVREFVPLSQLQLDEGRVARVSLPTMNVELIPVTIAPNPNPISPPTSIMVQVCDVKGRPVEGAVRVAAPADLDPMVQAFGVAFGPRDFEPLPNQGLFRLPKRGTRTLWNATHRNFEIEGHGPSLVQVCQHKPNPPLILTPPPE